MKTLIVYDSYFGNTEQIARPSPLPSIRRMPGRDSVDEVVPSSWPPPIC